MKTLALNPEQILKLAKKLAADSSLPIKPLSVELSEENITLRFSSPERVDFRAIVNGLAEILKTRVFLHQITGREEAAEIGAFGPCGRTLCCATFLNKKFPSPSNHCPSGICGKPACCGAFEIEVKKLKETPSPSKNSNNSLLFNSDNNNIDDNNIKIIEQEKVENVIPAQSVQIPQPRQIRQLSKNQLRHKKR